MTLLQCLAPLVLVPALLIGAVISIHRWPNLWPASAPQLVARVEARLQEGANRFRRWFAPRRGDPLDPVQLRIRQTYGQYKVWAESPANRLTLRVGIGSTIGFAAGIAGLFMPQGSLWQRAAMPVLAVTATVYLLDYLYRRRTDLLEKERVILQMGSRSNHVALDAARVVIERRWHRDGSLCGVVFERADLRSLTMARAKLDGASFMYAQLRDAELMFADLRDSRMGSSDLRNANLSFSDLENAVLGLADLENASLGRCSLRSAHLEGANLRDAFLEHADLEGTHLEQAIYNAKTRWPEGYVPPSEAINWDTLSDTERDWFRQWRWYLT
jgi:hypothetical protein